jgi:hypothetical protein
MNNLYCYFLLLFLFPAVLFSGEHENKDHVTVDQFVNEISRSLQAINNEFTKEERLKLTKASIKLKCMIVEEGLDNYFIYAMEPGIKASKHSIHDISIDFMMSDLVGKEKTLSFSGKFSETLIEMIKSITTPSNFSKIKPQKYQFMLRFILKKQSGGGFVLKPVSVNESIKIKAEFVHIMMLSFNGADAN